MDLPITAALPDLRDALRTRTAAVLQAPPGAGKTTLVPLDLVREPWLEERSILLLEPRRLAARAAAARMADLLGEAVGETVGYRMRGDSRIGPRTRIEVLTEGVLTRQLQRDPALERAGLVIFDEFHERSLHADLGLALTLQSRALLRPDLRILVMSATLDADAVLPLLGDALAVHSEGRSWPVDLRYLDRPLEPHTAPEAAARFALRSLERHDGDVLVFLPGAAEIERAYAALQPILPGVRVHRLHGTLTQAEQDLAIRPGQGERKIVLATSIAETSLTIEGVTVVVDSGLMRVPRFSPRTGMTRLETLRVTRSSAEQRAGRAGRLGPGVCYRLWTEGEHAALLAHGTPEILEADLAPLALELAAWGAAGPQELRWLDPPPAGAFAQAGELLRELGALDDAGRITPHGRALVDLPAHPRLAHMLLRARTLGLLPLACDLAALLDERDLFQRTGQPLDPDLRLRLDTLRTGRGPVDRGALQRVRREAGQWRHRLHVTTGDVASDDPAAPGLLLALAYPDRIAQRRGAGRDRVLLRNGRGAMLPASGALTTADYIVAAQLEDRGRESRIFLGAPIGAADIERHFAASITTETVVEFDAASGSVRARELRRLGALVLRERKAAEVPPERVAAALLDGVRQLGMHALDWSKDAAQLRARLAFLHQLDAAHWPDVSDTALLAGLEQWLLPFVPAARRLDDVRRADLAQALLATLTWQQRQELERLAPAHWAVPSGSNIAIDYGDPAAPVLPVRLQEMFGATDTPRIAGGAVPLTLHLLSPARRPVQVTRDLASFWRSAYFEVRKDLKGRYPKHYWPDDPLVAEPTRRTRPRG